MNPTEQQAVANYLRNRDIVYQEVFDELFDHLVLGITEAQQQGVPFAVALTQVGRELDGNDGLRKIQDFRKKSFDQQYKRWHRRQLVLSLRNPVVVGVAGLIGYVLWLALSNAPGPNRIQLLVGGFTTLFVAAWGTSLVAALRHYISFKKGIIPTPYHLGIWHINRLGLAVFCGFLPVMAEKSWSLSLLDLLLVWVVCMAMLAYGYIVIRLATSSYRLVDHP